MSTPGSPLGQRQPSVTRRRMSKEASSMPACFKEPAAYASGATMPRSSRWKALTMARPPPYAAVTNMQLA